MRSIGNINSLVFTKDNSTLISESEISKSENKIKVWDVSTEEQVDVLTVTNVSRKNSYTIFDDGTVISLRNTTVFTPNGEKMAIQTNDGIEIWDVLNKKHLNTFTKVDSRVGISAITTDGKILAVRMKSGISLWDTQTGKHLTLKTSIGWKNRLLEAFRLRRFSVYALAISPDGKTLAAGAKDKAIYLWDIPTNRHITTLKHEYEVSKLEFSPDGKILASGDSSGKIYLWEFATGRHLTTYKGHGNYISRLTFAPDGKTLASISGGFDSYGYNSGTIFLWDVPSK